MTRAGAGIRTWVVMAGIALAAGACVEGDDPVADRGFRDLPADHVAFGLVTEIEEGGSLRASIHADTAYTWEDSARMVMFPVELQLYDENGARTATLTADEGELDTNTNEMVARRNVVLITVQEERRLLTEELHYDPRSARIWSDVRTVMHQGGTTIQGTGFLANEDMTDIQVFESTGENLEIDF